MKFYIYVLAIVNQRSRNITKFKDEKIKLKTKTPNGMNYQIKGLFSVSNEIFQQVYY